MGVAVHRHYDDGSDEHQLESVLAELLEQVPADGYLAIQAFVDGERFARLRELRDRLAARCSRPVTFGWGPRFLHSTGQFHKGGPRTGVFIQILEVPDMDLHIPGLAYTWGKLLSAQASGDAEVLSKLGMPVATFTIHDAVSGVSALLGAAERV